MSCRAKAMHALGECDCYFTPTISWRSSKKSANGFELLMRVESAGEGKRVRHVVLKERTRWLRNSTKGMSVEKDLEFLRPHSRQAVTVLDEDDAYSIIAHQLNSGQTWAILGQEGNRVTAEALERILTNLDPTGEPDKRAQIISIRDDDRLFVCMLLPRSAIDAPKLIGSIDPHLPRHERRQLIETVERTGVVCLRSDGAINQILDDLLIAIERDLETPQT